MCSKTTQNTLETTKQHPGNHPQYLRNCSVLKTYLEHLSKLHSNTLATAMFYNTTQNRMSYKLHSKTLATIQQCHGNHPQYPGYYNVLKTTQNTLATAY